MGEKTPLLADLREPPVVGRFYMVPVIRDYPYNDRVDTWPVIGPKHTDAEFINFPDPHYHIDARFLTVRQERAALAGLVYIPTQATCQIEQMVGVRPLLSRGHALPSGRPVLARRKCIRETYGYALGHKSEIKALREHYEPASPIRLADGRILCPHRKADLSQFPADEKGIVTCPLHGLRVCVRHGNIDRIGAGV